MFRRLFDRFRAVPPYRHGGGFDNLGIGAEGLALIDYPRPPHPSYSDDRYGVRRGMDSLSVSNSDPMKMVTTTDLLANGHFLAGTLALNALIEKGGTNG